MDNWRYEIAAKFKHSGEIKTAKILREVSENFVEILGDRFNLENLIKRSKVRLNIEPPKNESAGRIQLLCDLNRVETVILAAALENINRVGSEDMDIEILRIKDTKTKLRGKILRRAEEILDSKLIDPEPTSCFLKKKVLRSTNKER